ncbi:MAG: DNA polymerase III subunit epsilon [Comamonadaceae bacterium]|nr:DNA polymerase III subunit epsilon [Comamonadaceae bacterium]
MTRQIVLDTETTGLSAETGDRVIELGCVELVNRKLTGNNLHLYFNPGRDSHPDALRVHGLTTEFLSDKPKFAEKVNEILAYLQDAELIIHNAPFDLGFLNKELSLLGLRPITEYVAKVTDSLVMAKELYPGKRNSLDALCSRLDVDNSGRELHGALLDSELLAEVYINMTRGQNALVMPDEDEEEASSDLGDVLQTIDLRSFKLPVLQASEQELAAHAALLEQIDKASGGKTIWRVQENTNQSVP